MRNPHDYCDRCKRDLSLVLLMDSPHPDDERVYCIDCYAYLFPPGWTDEIELTEPDESGLTPFEDEQ